MERNLEFTITDKYSGCSIKDILYNHYKMSSRLISKLKRNKGILLNGKSEFVTMSVEKGDILKIVLPSETSENIVSTPMSLNVVYEDSDIMIINKSPDLPVHPCQGNYDHTLANGVMNYWKKRGCQYVFRPVHRLDKNTSGLILIAKNQYAHQQLSGQAMNKQLIRKYVAIVHGLINKPEGVIILPIARKPGSIIERMISEKGQESITCYKVLKKLNSLTMVELSLRTGRTHQIRVHMSYIGHSLVGDWLYGNEDCELIKRHALHSCSLRFTHPVTRKTMRFDCDIPKDMKDLII